MSFHSEEDVNLWMFIVKQNIVDEKELSDRTQECVELMELLLNVGLERGPLIIYL